jgi:hypothetical protein
MLGFLNRRIFMLVLALAGSGAAVSVGNVINAAEIRYFVTQSTGLFEVKGSTGGRFITQPTSEYINVPGRGVLRVVGYTDRASRGEIVVSQVRGSGMATIWVTRTTNGQIIPIVPQFTTALPIVVARTVSPSTDFDNITGYVTVGGNTISRRLPIGTRP